MEKARLEPIGGQRRMPVRGARASYPESPLHPGASARMKAGGRRHEPQTAQTAGEP